MSTIALALSFIAVVIAYLTRKEQKKQMDLTARINVITERLTTSVEALKSKVGEESAQHSAAVQELRDRIAKLEMSDVDRAELEAAISALETSAASIDGAVNSVSVIVPDAPAEPGPSDPPTEEPAPSFTKTFSGTISTGSSFTVDTGSFTTTAGSDVSPADATD